MEEKKYAPRGGIKLEHALKEFGVDVTGLTVLDVGSSTGGFVDCLLQHGAAKVYSVDTAYGELAWKLRTDARVAVMERENILFLETLPEKVDLITIDVSFTSLTKVLPAVKKFLDPSTSLGVVALLKPQYEDQKEALAHHGIIPEKSQNMIIDRVVKFAEESGYQFIAQTESPILGREGNKEFLILFKLASQGETLRT